MVYLLRLFAADVHGMVRNAGPDKTSNGLYCLRWKECILVSNVTTFEIVLTICTTLNVAEFCVCVCERERERDLPFKAVCEFVWPPRLIVRDG